MSEQDAVVESSSTEEKPESIPDQFYAKPEEKPEPKPETKPEEAKQEPVVTPEPAKPESVNEEVEYKSKTARRIDQLLAKVKEMEAELVRSRTPKPQEAPKVPTKPDINTFNGTLEEFIAETDAYLKYETTRAVEEDRKAREEEKKNREIQENNERATKMWNDKAKKTIERNPDFASYVYIEGTTRILPQLVGEINRTTDEFLLESEVGPDILLDLAKDPERRAKLFAMNTRDSSRELAKMEDAIMARVKPGSAVTGAPRPPADVVAAGGGVPKAQSLEEVFWGK